MKKAVIILVITILFALVGCASCDRLNHVSPTIFGDLRFYFADENAEGLLVISVESSDEILFLMQEVNGILINGFWYDYEYYDGAKIYINLNAIAERTSLQGSSGALITTEVLVRTFSSFPNVNLIEILIDGENDRYGDHFDFSEVFIAVD